MAAVDALTVLYKKPHKLLSEGTTDEASVKNETKEARRSETVSMVQTL